MKESHQIICNGFRHRTLRFKICLLHHVNSVKGVVLVGFVILRKRIRGWVGENRVVRPEQGFPWFTIRKHLRLRLLVDLENRRIARLVSKKHVDAHSHLNDAVSENRFLYLFNCGAAVQRKGPN